MAAPERDQKPAGDEILGNLPHRRPGVASPRREAARGSSRPEPAPVAPPPPATESSALEDLARAGAGLAAAAAGTGLSIAGRAIGELGRALGRR